MKKRVQKLDVSTDYLKTDSSLLELEFQGAQKLCVSNVFQPL